MTQRKHSGGSTDRTPPRRPRADSATQSSGPTGAFAGKPSYGKAAFGKATGKPGYGKPSFGKATGGKTSGKAAFGKPRSDRSSAGPIGSGRAGTGKPSMGKTSWAKPARGPGRNRDEAPQRSAPYSDRSRSEGPTHAKPRSRPEQSWTDQPRPSKPSSRPDIKEVRPPARPAKPARAPDAPTTAPRPERPARLARNQVWLYGLHAVKAALANPLRQFHRLLLSRDASEAMYGDTSQINDLTPEIMTRDEIGRLLPAGAVHQGAALLTDTLRPIALEDVIDQAAAVEKTVIVILDQVTDPQNVGAILRSAAAFGAAAVVMPERHAPPETGALVKAASGAVELVPLVRVINLARAMEDIKAAGFWIAGLDGQAPQTLAAADMTGKVALVLGAEGEGLRRLTRDLCDILVRLPISARMESLNVSAAAAVAMYELARKA